MNVTDLVAALSEVEDFDRSIVIKFTDVEGEWRAVVPMGIKVWNDVPTSMVEIVAMPVD